MNADAAAGAIAATGGAPQKILVVDDSVIVLKTLSMKLTANGYHVLTATDGGTAVSLARKERPDLILLDISFPPDVCHGGGVPWDGFLIMDWLHRMEEAVNIPVIVITGGDPDKLKDRAMAAGAKGFFHKPINNDDLLKCVREIIGEGRGPIVKLDAQAIERLRVETAFMRKPPVAGSAAPPPIPPPLPTKR